MKPHWMRWFMRILKVLLTLLLLCYVGCLFAEDLFLLDYNRLEWRPEWLLASGILYLLALAPSAWFWWYLLGRFGYPLTGYAAFRAHYLGQLGKYVPGKALAVAIRADLIHPFGIPYGIAIIASFYEVLTGMAAGALTASLIYYINPPSHQMIGSLALGMGMNADMINFLSAMGSDEWQPVWLSAILIGVCLVPLLPGVFNFLAGKLTVKIQAMPRYQIPPLPLATSLLGLFVTASAWWIQGLSVGAMLQAVLPDPPPFSFTAWSQYTASSAFANVAGFAFFVAPAGLGVREALMKLLLHPVGPPGYIAAAVLLLRIDWILAEMAFAAGTYWWKPALPHAPARHLTDFEG